MKEAAYRDATRDKQREYYNRYAAKRRLTPEWREYMRRYKAQWLKGQKGRTYNQIKRRRRRSLELAVPGFCTPEQLEGRVALYHGRCWLCGAPAVAIDHVKPLTKGGSDWPANLRPICHPCNSRKSDIWPFPHRPRFS